MPSKPKKKLRPWEPKPVDYNKLPGQGRVFGGNQKFYRSRAWRKIREIKLGIDPLCECESCEKKEIALEANVVDHKKRINPINPYDTQGGEFGDPFDIDNLMSMNSRCHNRKSGKERYIKKNNKNNNNG